MDVLRGAGWNIEMHVSTTPEVARRLALCAANDQRDVVLVGGGDGTVSEVVNGLAGTATALAVLPMGTGNVWATVTGLVRKPRPFSAPNLVHAARLIAESEVRAVDIGLAKSSCAADSDGRYFLLWAGVGVDAWIAERMERGREATLKRRFGNLAYLAVGLARARQFHGERMTVVLDGACKVCSVLMVHIANVGLYGGGLLRIAQYARVDDGYLDVCIFKGEGVRACLSHLFRVWLGRHLGRADVEYRKVSRIALEGHALGVQTDGDPVGRLPAEFEVVPRGLRVLMPRTVT